jgi:TIR domain
MDNRLRKPYIFIAYQNFEHELAKNLQTLLETWGYEVFQCRQDHRDGEAYRKELRQNIRKSDLVIFLLSREFRWSAYCQAEAGTTMALEKPFIPILIPPADSDEVLKEIAPVLEGSQFLTATNADFISRLQMQIVETLAKSKESLAELISKLQNLQETELSGLTIHDIKKEIKDRECVYSTIQKIDESYRLSQPKKTISRTWSTLGDPACRASIVGNIEKLLRGDDKRVTLTFIGVSLKFSLHLITDALQGLDANNEGVSLPKKTLNINLVHMHDQSHILHALGDKRDIDSIGESFGKEWPTTKSTWKSLCGKAIEFVEPAVYRIDYIPPRVGIMLETGSQSLLYAGRCAFKQTDPRSHIFNLDVGENEYLFYSSSGTDGDDPNYKAIKEFKASFNAYKEIQNNSGITSVWESDPWILRLRTCIDELTGPAEVTFISGSAKKFEPLIKRALERGATVRNYVCDPGSSSKHARDLFSRLVSETGHLARHVEQHRYQHPATFRGMVIKDKVIGLQTYVNAGSNNVPTARRQATHVELVKKIPLCLIVTPCFAYFQELQQEVLTFADGDPLAKEILVFE